MTDRDDQKDLEAQRPDPADKAPAEGQSRDIPEQDQGQGQGTDTAYTQEPAEGSRDED